MKKAPHVGATVKVTHGSSALRIRPETKGTIRFLGENRVDVEFGDRTISFSTMHIGNLMTLHTERYKISVEVLHGRTSV